ncbi:MAG: sugar phosphate isomerase/epimerase family protein [Candidatus Hadarchaeales archaeon]
MRIGLSSLLFVNSTIEQAIRVTAELGFDCVEVIYDLPHFGPNFEPSAVRELGELIRSHGLLASVHATIWDINPASHYPAVRDLSATQIKRSIDVCERLGGRIVVVHPGRCPVPERVEVLDRTKKWYVEFLEDCLDYASERGITLAPENIDGAHYPYSDASQLKLLAESFEGLGITFDIGHAYIAQRRRGAEVPEENIAHQIREIERYLAHIHLHDNKGTWDDHLPPGEGEINFGPIIEALRAVKYDGLLVVELWDPESPGETARKGLAATRRLLGL